jgi:hypothetical protein
MAEEERHRYIIDEILFEEIQILALEETIFEFIYEFPMRYMQYIAAEFPAEYRKILVDLDMIWHTDRCDLLIINVPNRDKDNINSYLEDGVLGNIQFNIISPKTQGEYNFIVANIPEFINTIIVTGGHGSERDGKIGDINHRGQNTYGRPEHQVNVYFPDCDLGRPHSRNAIQSFWGSNAEIHAFNFPVLQDGSRDTGLSSFLRRVNSGWPVHDAFNMIERANPVNFGSPSVLDRIFNLFQ